MTLLCDASSLLPNSVKSMSEKSMHRMKWLGSGLISIFAFLYSSVSHAHVKWFIDMDTASETVQNFQPYSFTDMPVLIWIAIALTAIVIAYMLDKKLPVMHAVINCAPIVKQDVVELLRILTGMSFLFTTYEGALFAPHHIVDGTFGFLMLCIKIVVGVLLISNHFLKYAGMLICFLCLCMLERFGWVATLEYSNIFGIGMFLILSNLSSKDNQERYSHYAVDVLRIFTGVALVVLGFSEKISGAIYGEAFMVSYQWNFMMSLGFENYSDRLFVLSAGVCEVILGTVLLLGFLTRITTITVSLLMLASNITFIIAGNNDAALTELIGHLPVIGSALVLILFGYGERLKVTKILHLPDGTPVMEMNLTQNMAAETLAKDIAHKNPRTGAKFADKEYPEE